MKISEDIKDARILIVDDNLSTCLLYRQVLEHAGFEAFMAKDISQAEGLLYVYEFDAVLTDIRLPEYDGISLLKTIKDKNIDTQVVLITGYPDVDTASEAVRLGAYDYLAKPVSKDALLRVATRAVETKKLIEGKKHFEIESRQYKENLEKIVAERSRELMESERRYALATQAGCVGVFDWNLDTDDVYIDPNLKAMMGYSDIEIGNNLNDWVSHTSPEPVQDSREAILAHFVATLPQEGVTRKMMHKDGSSRWFFGRGSLMAHPDGTPYRMVGTYTDITGQKHVELELERRNTILEAVSYAADAFLRSDNWQENIDKVLESLGCATRVSRVHIFKNQTRDDGSLEAVCWYEWAKPGIPGLLKQSGHRRVPFTHGGFKKWKEKLSRGYHVKGYVDSFPETVKEVLKEQGTVAILNVPIFVDNLWWGFISYNECEVSRDWTVSEIEALRVAAGTLGAAIYREDQMMERMRLFTAIQQSTESIIITDCDGLIQYVNPAFEAITGYAKEEVLGKTHDILKSGKHDESFFETMHQTIEKGNVCRCNLINRKKNGELFEEEAIISPVRNSEGNIINFVSIKRDVTEKKRLEAIAQAANLMENIGYVFSGIRHELGNPINSIKMTLTVLNKSMDRFDNETVREFLERCLSEVSHVEYLLKALRNFNMFERPRIQSVRIDHFMKKFISLISDDFKRQGISIKMLSSAWSMVGLVDPRALHQVLLNIMINSADALEGCPNPMISFDFDRTSGWIQMKVHDNGCGMTLEQKRDLFKPFFTSKPNGTGLGLVIVKKMLSEMNCTIDIESEAGNGTIVKLAFPEGGSE